MEEVHKYFIASFVVIILLISGLSYYQYTEFEALKQTFRSNYLDLNSKIDITTSNLDAKLNVEVTNLKGTISTLNDDTNKKIDDVNTKITQTEAQIGEVKEDLEAEITGLETNLAGDFTKIIRDATLSTVSVLTNVGRGSGAITRSHGKTVTNAHVTDGASQIAIQTSDNKLYVVEVVGVDNNADIAVLKPVNANNTFEIFKFADSDDIQVGERVIALGNPFGLDFTATQGIVSATNRVARNGLSYVQIDVPINPGNSGGPLINDEGRIIGLNNFKVGGGEGLGFAIPSNTIQDVVDDIS
jgi:S1-C subfamily serine protease